MFDVEVELDESYFGGARKGKRGRGAAGKIIVFGLLKRNDKVYTIIVPDTKASTLMFVISKKITPDSIVYTDRWHSYNVLDVRFFVIIESIIQAILQNGQNHINGIENF
ncbi:IS1595 family transposase [Acinetobacter sp. ANC 4470]|uniref:IS1595 family transposase n=1 Tax=Acinetobacter sp. ANC 4470 TaxID=1977881 RepID=UPI000A33B2AE